MILPTFSKKMHEIEKMLGRRGGDPLRSTTADISISTVTENVPHDICTTECFTKLTKVTMLKST